MPHAKVVRAISELDFRIGEVPTRPRSQRVLMVSPEHFDVLYVINPHMAGNIGQVDSALANTQWDALRRTYERLGYPVEVLRGVDGLPDMVFAANQSFPYLHHQERTVVMSKMRSSHREPEVEHFAQWYERHGYNVIRQVSPPVHFEGMGDARWHPDRKLLYLGYGYRTASAAIDRAAAHFECPVIGLELVDPRFYHLDTALSPIDETTAVYVPHAFSDAGVAVLKALFPRLLPVPPEEAEVGFAANGHCPDRRHFIVQRGNPHTNELLTELGYEVLEVDTSEFLKSGGSVYCMKMMLP